MSAAIPAIRRKVIWGATIAFVLQVLLFGLASPARASGPRLGQKPGARPQVADSGLRRDKLDNDLAGRAEHPTPGRRTRVIATLAPGQGLPEEFKPFAVSGETETLTSVNGRVLEVPDAALGAVAAHGAILRLDDDRPVALQNFRTAVTVGARAVVETLGLSGAGVGIAVVDSGVTSWHDDLTGRHGRGPSPYGNQRVAAFVDFVNGRTRPYDDNGHGTHVAGTIAGNGFDTLGRRAGMAPEATLVSLKVLDANGRGKVSDVIRAFDWIAANGKAYNIRVVNVSIGAAIHSSFWTDPLTLAAKRVVDQGIVVVAAAGNFGKNAQGERQWGGITAPCNAAWVLCVGASSTMGTLSRRDDTLAGYSSRGPTYKDYHAKPDIVAPGTGTVSLSDPSSTLYGTMSAFLVPGSIPKRYLTYLTLTGTSMSAPVVSGSIAQMLQVNPRLTPNLVKAILQYTAQVYQDYTPLEQGAGFLNTVGAVRLARFFANARPGDRYPTQRIWSRHIIWGNYQVSGGYLKPTADAFGINVVWGAKATHTNILTQPDGTVHVSYEGDNITWGSMCDDVTCDNITWGSDDDNITWGSVCEDDACDNITWGSSVEENIVWGEDCGGADCDNITWGSTDEDNITWGSVDPGDNITWGSGGDDNITWGSADEDNITWGSVDPGDNITWGSDDADNITWGSDDLDNITWGSDDDNITWGSGDNITWGSDDNITWGSSERADGTVTGAFAARGPKWRGLFDRLTDEQLFHVIGSLPGAPARSITPGGRR